MSLSTPQLLFLHFLSSSSPWTPCGGSMKPGGGGGGEEGWVSGRRWKNAISSLSLEPLRNFGLYNSSSTVSSRLQLLITTTLHQRLSTVHMQHLFRWLAAEPRGCDGSYLTAGAQRSALQWAGCWWICHSCFGLGLQTVGSFINKWRLMYYVWGALWECELGCHNPYALCAFLSHSSPWSAPLSCQTIDIIHKYSKRIFI